MAPTCTNLDAICDAVAAPSQGHVTFSQSDFTEDLKKIGIPVLVMHGFEADLLAFIQP